MDGTSGAPNQSERGSSKYKLVAPFLSAGRDEALGIGVVNQTQTQEGDGKVDPELQVFIAHGAFIVHVPGNGGDIVLAQPFHTGDM
jgi:hypothetical protein